MTTKNEDFIIEADNLTHYYGPQPAIENVDFKVKRGEILGFLGPNGAGKTTTMRILTGYMPPTRGNVEIDGMDIVKDSLECRKKIGYLPETVPLHTDMTVKNYLTFMGSLRGMSRRSINDQINNVIEICRLQDYYKTIVGKLSKGYRQRVGIAQAILHEPEILVMDEPTIGIDPIQVVETRRLIQDIGKQQTVVLSSHILPEVSMVCGRVLIINQGQIVAEDTPDNLATRLQATQQILVEISTTSKKIQPILENIEGVTDVRRRRNTDNITFEITVADGYDVRDEISKIIIENDCSLLSMQLNSMSLEQIFLKLTTTEGA
ncbi:MAG: MFS transporter [Dehalococcoidia bacterium]|jgi:ABC-2 type transport system ATP-binding protein|nr:MFS transporter [Dehalococcoidia bacterium]MQG08022.1 ATP-binding cassette domain-containing protein [SAR202 cluster bacterium]CAI8271780.1 MAG: putative ABC transporter ATP-binding protein YxlF [Chloroflexota bacterium]MCH2529024.1 ABC transporter ATP-binding protein [Dehalococcoidia bacterium]MQG26344.1 ATP-binding cassette domain-containing protein [SAR202 cluster bacterium]|tara:strand:+ start:5734 stop:6693 length:960 start_codon:yes stop_codon:yes gene_type:complete